MRVLFVEPFYEGSHAAFLDGLVRHSGHEIVPLTLPGGEWRRRMQSGAQELAPLALELPGQFDVLISTDMLDLPAFLALARHRFSSIPVLAYFHENQMTYPRLRGTKFNSWFGSMNYLSALVANAVAFNSEYHREDFLGALESLAGEPNNWIVTRYIEAVRAKGRVLPVGVELGWLERFRPAPGSNTVPLVLWAHRWEFDKAPDVFARALLQLAGEGIAFEVAIAGDPGPNPHRALSELRDALGARVVQFGRVEDREGYAALLWQTDIAVSTARHEFFGVGMVEALYAGCFPVVPARYNYPALIPPALHERCLWETEPDLVRLLRNAIVECRRPAPEALRASAARFAWDQVAPAWDTALEELAPTVLKHLSPSPDAAGERG